MKGKRPAISNWQLAMGRMTRFFIAVYLGGFQHPRYISFHIRMAKGQGGEPSRSDELMVAVRLQSTESGFGRLGASRQ
jgi:hypothetical protein